MKKSCNGCRAHSGGSYCKLGYITKILYIPILTFGNRELEKMVPLEPCPKPKTYDDYYLQQKLKVKKN